MGARTNKLSYSRALW
nr:unnamed protein product [Callosobruchus analis]